MLIPGDLIRGIAAGFVLQYAVLRLGAADGNTVEYVSVAARGAVVIPYVSLIRPVCQIPVGIIAFRDRAYSPTLAIHIIYGIRRALFSFDDHGGGNISQDIPLQRSGARTARILHVAGVGVFDDHFLSSLEAAYHAIAGGIYRIVSRISVGARPLQ